MKKKVLYVITKSNFGGAQRYVYDLATSLPQAEFEAVVALGGAGPLKEKLEKAGVRTLSIASLQRDVSFSKEVSAFHTLSSVIKSESPDVLHLNSTKAGILGALAGRVHGVPQIIFTGHGWAFNEDRPWWQRMLIACVQWLTILLSHTTIAVSQKTAADILRLPFVKRKVRVVYNGIGTIDFYDRTDARARIISHAPQLRTSTAQRWIGINSELHKNKGIDIAIDALAPLLKQDPDTIVLVMSGGEERSVLAQKIERAGVGSSFFLLGYVEDSRRYLHAFDIFLMPSRTEALPYALVEAGYAALPVAASRVGGIPEIVTNKESGLLFDPKNITEVRSAVEALLQDMTHARSLGERLQQDVSKRFSLEKMLIETTTLYKKNVYQKD